MTSPVLKSILIDTGATLPGKYFFFKHCLSYIKSLEERFESILLVEARLGFNFKLSNFWHKREFKMQILGDSLLEAETQHLQSKNRFLSFSFFFSLLLLFSFFMETGVVEKKAVLANLFTLSK